MGRRLTVVLTALGVWIAVLLLFLVVVGRPGRAGGGGGGFFGPRVAVLELEGVIVDGDDLVRDLKAVRDDPGIRAVVIRINSPGGVVGPTQEIHDAILRVRQAGKPVVASLGAVAASGGYYAAVAAQEIWADPGTLTGSIGVIMQLPNVEQLLKKVGVDYVVVKAGQFKDTGNFARQMTPEERRVLQTLLDDVHGQFIDAVATGRHLPREEVVRFADGRIFSGTQAKALHMVDELGGLEDAVDGAARLAGLHVPPVVVRPRKKFSILDLVRTEIGIPAPAFLPPVLPMFRTPLYLMD